MIKILGIFGILMAAMALQSCSISTAGISNVKLCDNADDAGNCVMDSKSFTPDDTEIFISASIDNAPSGTTVTASWRYLGGELGSEPIDIDSVTSTVTDGGTVPYYSSLSPPADGWPKGDYEVTIKLSNENSTPVTKQFTVS